MYLFTPDGWAWNIESSQVRELLRRIRSELYELFGPGEYMHIGCDEAYYISRCPEIWKKLPQYLHDLTSDVRQESRRPMLWMDMLLEKDAFQDCYAGGEKEEVEALRNACSESSVFVDWQYGCVEAPVPSLLSLKDCGRDVMGAPLEPSRQLPGAHPDRIRSPYAWNHAHHLAYPECPYALHSGLRQVLRCSYILLVGIQRSS